MMDSELHKHKDEFLFVKKVKVLCFVEENWFKHCGILIEAVFFYLLASSAYLYIIRYKIFHKTKLVIVILPMFYITCNGTWEKYKCAYWLVTMCVRVTEYERIVYEPRLENIINHSHVITVYMVLKVKLIYIQRNYKGQCGTMG